MSAAHTVADCWNVRIGDDDWATLMINESTGTVAIVHSFGVPVGRRLKTKGNIRVADLFAQRDAGVVAFEMTVGIAWPTLGATSRDGMSLVGVLTTLVIPALQRAIADGATP